MATPRPQEAQNGENAVSNVFGLSPGWCPPITAPGRIAVAESRVAVAESRIAVTGIKILN